MTLGVAKLAALVNERRRENRVEVASEVPQDRGGMLLRRHTVADVRIRDALLGGAARLNRTNSTDPAGNETGSANHSFGARPTGS